MKINFIIGILVGIVVSAIAIASFLLIAMSTQYHYDMNYPHTEVWIDKDKKIRNICFEVKDNSQLPLYIRSAEQVLKLDASTTISEIKQFLDLAQCGYYVTCRQNFDKLGKCEVSCEIFFSKIRVYSENGETLSKIDIWNDFEIDKNDSICIASSTNKQFVFPLERENVENLLGKEYQFQKRFDK